MNAPIHRLYFKMFVTLLLWNLFVASSFVESLSFYNPGKQQRQQTVGIQPSAVSQPCTQTTWPMMNVVSRRHWLDRLMTNSGVLGIVASTAIVNGSPAAAAAATTTTDPRKTVTLHLDSPSVKAGLELIDVTIGTPPRNVPAIRKISSQVGIARFNSAIQPGLILRDYATAADVVKRLSQGPYPIDLEFENLAAGGDAFGDLEKPLVTAQDALELSRKTASTNTPKMTTSTSTLNEYVVQEMGQRSSSEKDCGVKSRRGDLIEISYEARLLGPDGPLYDSSDQRGTGLPYQMVLGSGDMLPGVDLGLYDMCPGDTRALGIPPSLAYGTKGNRLWEIPPNTRLYWTVELISVNSVRAGDARTRDEMEGRELSKKRKAF